MNYTDFAIKEFNNKRNHAPLNDDFSLCREILQELILQSLSKTDFFDNAVFEGGTFLRIVHNNDRYSEDLDFATLKPQSLSLQPYFDFIKQDFSKNGLEIETTGKEGLTNVQKGWIKDTSIAKVLNLDYIQNPKIQIKTAVKLEIDTNPPSGANYEIKNGLRTVDLESGFAGKCHALLKREYVKGRDWYDLLFYVDKRIVPNFTLLQNALIQSDVSYSSININSEWLCNSLNNKIDSLTFDEIANDLTRFVDKEKLDFLKQLGKDYFYRIVKELRQYSEKNFIKSTSNIQNKIIIPSVETLGPFVPQHKFSDGIHEDRVIKSPSVRTKKELCTNKSSQSKERGGR